MLGNELLRKLLHGVGFFDECSAHHSDIGALGGRRGIQQRQEALEIEANGPGLVELTGDAARIVGHHGI